MADLGGKGRAAAAKPPSSQGADEDLLDMLGTEPDLDLLDDAGDITALDLEVPSTDAANIPLAEIPLADIPLKDESSSRDRREADGDWEAADDLLAGNADDAPPDFLDPESFDASAADMPDPGAPEPAPPAGPSPSPLDRPVPRATDRQTDTSPDRTAAGPDPDSASFAESFQPRVIDGKIETDVSLPLDVDEEDLAALRAAAARAQTGGPDRHLRDLGLLDALLAPDGEKPIDLTRDMRADPDEDDALLLDTPAPLPAMPARRASLLRGRHWLESPVTALVLVGLLAAACYELYQQGPGEWVYRIY